MPIGRGVWRAFAGESPTTSRAASLFGPPESFTLASVAAPPLPEPLPADPPLPLAPVLPAVPPPLVVLDEVLAAVIVAPAPPPAPWAVLPLLVPLVPLGGGLSLELQPRNTK